MIAQTTVKHTRSLPIMGESEHFEGGVDDIAGPTAAGEAKGFVRLRNSVWGTIIGKDEGRERWSSRIAFFFAAVGSAVG